MAVELDGEAVGFGCSYTRLKEIHIMVGSLINIFRFYRFDQACCAFFRVTLFELLRKKPSFRSEYLCNFGVVEKYRGQKIAHTIFQLMLDQARQRGIKSLICDVSSDNIKARGLYGYWGFTATGLRVFPLTSIKPHYQMTIDITNYPA